MKTLRELIENAYWVLDPQDEDIANTYYAVILGCHSELFNEYNHKYYNKLFEYEDEARAAFTEIVNENKGRLAGVKPEDLKSYFIETVELVRYQLNVKNEILFFDVLDEVVTFGLIWEDGKLVEYVPE